MEILKYSTSTLPCKPHCIRQQEELRVQDDMILRFASKAAQALRLAPPPPENTVFMRVSALYMSGGLTVFWVWKILRPPEFCIATTLPLPGWKPQPTALFFCFVAKFPAIQIPYSNSIFPLLHIAPNFSSPFIMLSTHFAFWIKNISYGITYQIK